MMVVRCCGCCCGGMSDEEEDETAFDDRSFLIKAGRKGNPRDSDTPCVELVDLRDKSSN